MLNLKSMKGFASLLTLTLIVSISFIGQTLTAQVDARMLRYPDVSASHIAFTYAGDIWVVPKSGGVAVKLSSPKGTEGFAKFSPDGTQIAFTGNYNGNTDIYVIDAMGGVPKRLTYHGGGERLLDWHPDGDRVLFTSSRESGRQRYSQFYTIGIDGGMAEKLPVPYGEFGAYSPDGKQFAYTDRSRAFRTWKRYRGGTAPDIQIFNLENFASENITLNPANDEIPMWADNGKIYYLSDNGPNKRFNLWEYDLGDQSNKQITKFKDFDVHFPSLGPDDIVFEAGGKIYLYSLESGKYNEVEVDVVTDQMAMTPRVESVQRYVASGRISPDGKRAIIEARGELFSLPAENGYVKNLTHSSGVAERSPAWSPNGKYIAYWSDRSGEYELTIYNMKDESEKKLTSYGPGFRYQLYWSPDSKKLAFIDQSMSIKVYDMDADKTMDVDKANYMFHGGLSGFSVTWSPHSRWLAYSRDTDNRNDAVFVYDTWNDEKRQVTSGFYSDQQPAFDPSGDYLYLLTNRNFSPVYSDYDNSFVYPNSTHLAVIPLRKDVKSPLSPENDEVTIQDDEEEEEMNEEKEEQEMEKEEPSEETGSDEAEEEEEDKESIEIDFDGFEQRMIILPPDAGNYNRLRSVEGKVIYVHYPNTGSGDNNFAIKYFDLKGKKEQTIIERATYYDVSADGKKMMVVAGPRAAIIDVAPKQKMDKTLPLDEMEMTLHPKKEWVQIFNDAWRLERDFFYDRNMHGVDWDKMREQYGALIEDASTRGDVNYVLGELIGELNASHTYRGGGDVESSDNRNVGYLGIDWEIKDGHYAIKEIIRGAAWDVESRSPLDEPGVDLSKGDYILEVNGVPLSTDKEPYAAFNGLAGKTVELTVAKADSLDNTHKLVVELMRSETRLRHLAWIEHNRKMVDEASNGRIGYIYVRSTGIDGQNELVRQFSGQWHKDALIIDERFNSGGQIPDRFIELLNRKPLAYWDTRDGKDWQWPPIANFGPKAMLINGWSGSGGDAFPDYFRKSGLGPLIGARTWGGLIGISGSPSLVDGGSVTVPTFRMYDPDGEWFKEGYGVDPDIEVPEDPTELAKGNDPQIMRAVEYLNGEMSKPQYKKKKPTKYEVR